MATNESISLPPSARGAPILPILTVNFIGTLGFSIVLPFLVYLVTDWGGNAIVYGAVSATYSAGQLIGAPVLGRWSDLYGRKRILLLSQLGTLVSWMILFAAFFVPPDSIVSIDSKWLGSFILTAPLLILIAARAMDGLTGGNVSVANAYLADITTDAERNVNFGKLSVSSNLGFVMGPAIAGLLGATVLGEKLPVLAAMLISAVATFIIAFRLDESNPKLLEKDPCGKAVRKVFGQEQKECYRMKGEPMAVRDVIRIHGVLPLLVIYFLVMLGFNFFYVGFPVWAVNGLGWNVTEVGIFFSVLSLLMVLVQGPLLVRVSRRWDEAHLVLFGSLILAASFAFVGSRSEALVYCGAALLALGNGLMWPSVLACLSSAAGPDQQGAVQGFAGSAGSVASIIGLLAGGILFASLGPGTFLISTALILTTTAIAGIRLMPSGTA